MINQVFILIIQKKKKKKKIWMDPSLSSAGSNDTLVQITCFAKKLPASVILLSVINFNNFLWL